MQRMNKDSSIRSSLRQRSGTCNKDTSARRITPFVWDAFNNDMQSWLKKSETDLSVSSNIRQRFLLLHQQLFETDEDYRQALEYVQSSHQMNKGGWTWQPLIDTAKIRAGLLTVHQGKPIPLHNHPNSNGLSLVLSGRVFIHQFDEICPMTGTKLMKLQSILEYEYGPAEVSTFRKKSGNVHSLAARTPECTLLQVVLPPYQEEQRYWYFPLTEQVHDTTTLAMRVPLHRARSIDKTSV